MPIIRFCYEGVPSNEIGEHLICHDCLFNSWNKTKGQVICGFHDASLIDRIVILQKYINNTKGVFSHDNRQLVDNNKFCESFNLLIDILNDTIMEIESIDSDKLGSEEGS